MFDSGVGGLSIYRAFHELAPNESVVYFADTAFFPYGPRPAAEVRKRSFAITQRLIEAGAKLIVVACNTASAAAITDLREAFPIPFVGMVPGVKPAATMSRSKKVAILATSGTLDGELFTRVADEFGRGTVIKQVHDDSLAGIVEDGDAGTERARAALRRVLAREIESGTDTVVLGCTHFHFLANDIHAEFPGVALVDTSEPVARRAVQLLVEHDLRAPAGRIGHLDVIVSGDRDRFREVVAGLDIVHPVQEEA